MTEFCHCDMDIMITVMLFKYLYVEQAPNALKSRSKNGACHKYSPGTDLFFQLLQYKEATAVLDIHMYSTCTDIFYNLHTVLPFQCSVMTK